MILQMDNDTREEQLRSRMFPEEHFKTFIKQNEFRKIEEFSLDGCTNYDEETLSGNMIPTNPASQSYSSSLMLPADDSKQVDGWTLQQDIYSDHFSDPTGRMDEEQLPHESQVAFYSGYSESEDESRHSSTVLAPEPSPVRSNRTDTEYWLREIYEKNRLFDLDEIAEEAVRGSLQLILPLIFDSCNPEDPTCPDQRTGANKAKLLIFMRKDQYVKKAWSKLKTMIYSKHKRPKTLKTAAHEKLRQELVFEAEADKVFENLFGSGTCDGLKVESIEYIISNENIFKMIFNKDFFRKLREELNKQTLHDIKVNFLNKLDGYLTGAEGGREEAMAHFRADRSVKTPFTFLENNTSLVVLVDQFIKQLKKMEMDGAGKEPLTNTLTSLRDDLTKYADTRKWTLPGCKFKKSEIVSFVSR